ncbi:MAG: PilN domain-containing protein [Patescibacteria group bacterium]|jgi:Tfp pilus assembly protein PilN
MINLNFTSPAQRVENQFQKNYKLVQFLVLITIVILLIIVSFLYFSQMILQNKLDKLTLETVAIKEQTESNESLNLGQSVISFNSLVQNVSSIQLEYILWSDIFIEIGNRISDGVVLSSLSIQKSNGTFQISGTAETRDSLLSFKNNLEISPFFENIDSPISNLLSKENISFTLSGRVILNPQNAE